MTLVGLPDPMPALPTAGEVAAWALAGSAGWRMADPFLFAVSTLEQAGRWGGCVKVLCTRVVYMALHDCGSGDLRAVLEQAAWIAADY